MKFLNYMRRIAENRAEDTAYAVRGIVLFGLDAGSAILDFFVCVLTPEATAVVVGLALFCAMTLI